MALDSVGATQQEGQIHREGVDYVKDQALGSGSGGQSESYGQGMHNTSSHTDAQPPPSNPATDASGGIPPGGGGVSSAAHVLSPVQSEDHTIVGTVMSYLGLGGTQEKKAEDVAPIVDASHQQATPGQEQEARNAGNVTSSTSGEAATVAAAPVAAIAAASGVGAAAHHQSNKDTTTTQPSFTAEVSDRTRSNMETANSDGLSSSGQQPGRDTSSYTIGESLGTSATAQDNREGLPEENRNVEPSGRGQVFDESRNAPSEERAEQAEEAATEHKKPQMGDSNQRKGGLENKDAIPTAGGEKLGEKHWGESKIVPDNPKPQDSGVASKEGQPDSTTSDNTAKNTGGATGGPHSHGNNSQGGESGEGKEKFMDKVKDKLHIGKKE